MTLVVYMGIARSGAIQNALLAAGLAASTPILVVENASLPGERQLRTRLARLAEDIAEREIVSPAVMVIGEVARAAQWRQSVAPHGAAKRAIAAGTHVASGQSTRQPAYKAPATHDCGTNRLAESTPPRA